MVLMTVLTNLLGFPTLYVLHAQQQTFPLYIGGYTVLCSFLYHLSESLQVDSLYLDHDSWHPHPAPHPQRSQDTDSRTETVQAGRLARE